MRWEGKGAGSTDVRAQSRAGSRSGGAPHSWHSWSAPALGTSGERGPASFKGLGLLSLGAYTGKVSKLPEPQNTQELGKLAALELMGLNDPEAEWRKVNSLSWIRLQNICYLQSTSKGGNKWRPVPHVPHPHPNCAQKKFGLSF